MNGDLSVLNSEPCVVLSVSHSTLERQSHSTLEIPQQLLFARQKRVARRSKP